MNEGKKLDEMHAYTTRLRNSREVLQSLRNKLDESEGEQIALVISAYRAGMLQREIAGAAGISQQRVSQILARAGALVSGKDGVYARRRHHRKDESK